MNFNREFLKIIEDFTNKEKPTKEDIAEAFESLIDFSNYLIDQLENVTFIVKEYEKALKEKMPEKEYKSIMCSISDKAIRYSISKMPEGDFKTFCENNLMEESNDKPD